MSLIAWKAFCAAIPILFMGLGIAFAETPGYLYRRRQRRLQRESPLSSDMVRPPGYSIGKKVLDLHAEVAIRQILLVVSPVLLFSVYASLSYFAAEPQTPILIGTVICLVLGVEFYFYRDLARLFESKRRHQLGQEGEMFTGEELNQLMLLGYRVFHDIQFPYGNIDHVVVCPAGVFSINTKAYSKPIDGPDKAKAKIDHTHNRIQLPDRTVELPVSQLQGEAKWLAEFLTSATAQPIEVQPMLALPGWFVTDVTRLGPVNVFSPRNCSWVFKKRPPKLSAEQIQQVAHQLEQRCRDVAPSFREKAGSSVVE